MKIRPSSRHVERKGAFYGVFSYMQSDCTFFLRFCLEKYSDFFRYFLYYMSMFQDSQSVTDASSKAILLYGNSILIAGLNRKLENLPGWRVLYVSKGQPGDLTNVKLIIIDLRDASSAHMLTTLEDHPQILLVGMDSLTNSLTLLTRQTQPMRSLQDVLDALQQAL